MWSDPSLKKTSQKNEQTQAYPANEQTQTYSDDDQTQAYSDDNGLLFMSVEVSKTLEVSCWSKSEKMFVLTLPSVYSFSCLLLWDLSFIGLGLILSS